METQARYGDILVTLGGTEGVLYLANLYHGAGKPVVPLNLAITPENEALLRTGYSSRTEKELAVLSRWFPKESIAAPPAKYLDLILYSREQIRIENAAMGEDSGSDAPWGIVSVKAQDVDSELPMQPITMMRNALGADEGGSGVALDAAKYRESVAYWAGHAPIQ